jgi:hypothetical protein
MQRYENDIRTHISVHYLDLKCFIDWIVTKNIHWQLEVQIWMCRKGV